MAEAMAWEEAQVVDATPEQRQVFEKNFREVTDKGQIRGIRHDMSAYRSQPLEDADAEIMKHGPYLCEIEPLRFYGQQETNP